MRQQINQAIAVEASLKGLYQSARDSTRDFFSMCRIVCLHRHGTNPAP